MFRVGVGSCAVKQVRLYGLGNTRSIGLFATPSIYIYIYACIYNQYVYIYICLYIQSVCVYIYIHRSCNIEGSLEVKLPTIWADGKAEVGRVSEEKSKKNARRCGAKHISKSKVLKTDGFGPLLEIVMSKKCMPLWREAHLDVEKVHAVVARSNFQAKMHKTHHARSTFGSSDVEKVHAVVARSTLPSQKCKKLRGLEHFWTFRCRFAWQAHGILHLANNEQNDGPYLRPPPCQHTLE